MVISILIKLLQVVETLKNLIVSAKNSTEVVELDQTKIGRLSRMDAIQRQSMASEMERRREVDLRRVEAAIERLKSGDFSDLVQNNSSTTTPVKKSAEGLVNNES